MVGEGVASSIIDTPSTTLPVASAVPSALESTMPVLVIVISTTVKSLTFCSLGVNWWVRTLKSMPAVVGQPAS